jgi:hypothetical protein
LVLRSSKKEFALACVFGVQFLVEVFFVACIYVIVRRAVAVGVIVKKIVMSESDVSEMSVIPFS